MSNWIFFQILFFLRIFVLGGHEVLYKFQPADDDLKPNDIAIVQFDTRKLADYWNASARWNKYFAMSHGHQYLFLYMRGKCEVCKLYFSFRFDICCLIFSTRVASVHLN